MMPTMAEDMGCIIFQTPSASSLIWDQLPLTRKRALTKQGWATTILPRHVDRYSKITVNIYIAWEVCNLFTWSHRIKLKLHSGFVDEMSPRNICLADARSIQKKSWSQLDSDPTAMASRHCNYHLPTYQESLI
jgi:hypothetical protein